MCNASLLGGHVEVEDKVFIGGGAAAHQFTRIGTMAMIGGLTRVVQDVLPYTLLECDAEVRGLNLVGIRRSNLSEEAKRQIKEIYNIVYQSGFNTTNAVAKIKNIPSLTKEARHIIDFIEKSKRGLCKSRRELKK
jgi:UDP-N-acetylglucosamine acyltransferase